MTVIAWDGKTLAADKRGDDGSIVTVTKIKRIRDCLVGGSGNMSGLVSIFHWYECGAEKKDWPEFQKDKELWCDLLVITPERKIFKYEQQPIPHEIEDGTAALGSGSPYALIAMYLGKSASEAVLLASRFNRSCGNGVDTLEF